jgi:hypothetical protein
MLVALPQLPTILLLVIMKHFGPRNSVAELQTPSLYVNGFVGVLFPLDPLEKLIFRVKVDE